MIKHLRYAKYVALHKWFVFVAGRKTGAPLWRLLIHDWSKLTPAEWSPYVENFYGEKTDETRAAFRIAFLHHIHKNPHHWEHWVLKQPQPMPLPFVKEMVADWMGAGQAITGKWEVVSWYEANRDKIKLEQNTRVLVEQLIDRVTKEISDET